MATILTGGSVTAARSTSSASPSMTTSRSQTAAISAEGRQTARVLLHATTPRRLPSGAPGSVRRAPDPPPPRQPPKDRRSRAIFAVRFEVENEFWPQGFPRGEVVGCGITSRRAAWSWSPLTPAPGPWRSASRNRGDPSRSRRRCRNALRCRRRFPLVPGRCARTNGSPRGHVSRLFEGDWSSGGTSAWSWYFAHRRVHWACPLRGGWNMCPRAGARHGSKPLSAQWWRRAGIDDVDLLAADRAALAGIGVLECPPPRYRGLLPRRSRARAPGPG